MTEVSTPQIVQNQPLSLVFSPSYIHTSSGMPMPMSPSSPISAICAFGKRCSRSFCAAKHRFPKSADSVKLQFVTGAKCQQVVVVCTSDWLELVLSEIAAHVPADSAFNSLTEATSRRA